MGDMGEDFRAMDKEKKDRHKEWHTTNRRLIDKSPFNYKDRGETLFFRQKGKPKVDFYPSTGRWRVAGLSKTFRGGATAFLTWYERQVVPSVRKR